MDAPQLLDSAALGRGSVSVAVVFGGPVSAYSRPGEILSVPTRNETKPATMRMNGPKK